MQSEPASSPALTLGGIGYGEGVTMADQVWIQFLRPCWSPSYGVAWAASILYKIVDLIVGLRPSDENEREGLDITYHGEAAYHPE